MVKKPPSPTTIPAALAECGRQAKKCLDKSINAQNPILRTDWLALAEQWVKLAERISHIENDRPSS